MTNINEMSEPAKLLMGQIGQWDSVQECFELFIPMPHTIKTPFNGDVFDLSMEIHKLFEEYEGLSYSTTMAAQGEFVVAGVRLK